MDGMGFLTAAQDIFVHSEKSGLIKQIRLVKFLPFLGPNTWASPTRWAPTSSKWPKISGFLWGSNLFQPTYRGLHFTPFKTLVIWYIGDEILPSYIPGLLWAKDCRIPMIPSLYEEECQPRVLFTLLTWLHRENGGGP